MKKRSRKKKRSPRESRKESRGKSPEISKPIERPAPEIPVSSSKTVLASPAVRRRARESGINLSSLNGSGPAGRIRHADIDAFVAGGGAIMGAPPVAYSTKRKRH